MRATVGAACALLVCASSLPAQAAAGTTLAYWPMNEPAGSSIMTDDGGNQIDGTIGAAVATGTAVDGATGYRWSFTRPNEAPAKPERLVLVDDARLNPGTSDYAVTVTFRTTRSFGNIIQKGQSRGKGGFFKWQIPKGKLVCVFRGVVDGVLTGKAVNSGTMLLNDGAWHTVRCERTADRLTMTIDGVKTRRAAGQTGDINAALPLAVGGKSKCDQVKVTCDYFVGDIDEIRIEKG